MDDREQGKERLEIWFGYNKAKNEFAKAKDIIKDQKELLDRVLSGVETLSDFARNILREVEQFLKEVSE